MRRGSHDEGMELMHHRCDLDQRSSESPLMTAVNIWGWRGYRMGCHWSRLSTSWLDCRLQRAFYASWPGVMVDRRGEDTGAEMRASTGVPYSENALDCPKTCAETHKSLKSKSKLF